MLKPIKFRWFEKKGFKVLDFETGGKALIIKVKDSEEDIHYYGMPYRPIDLD